MYCKPKKKALLYYLKNKRFIVIPYNLLNFNTNEN